MPPPRPPARRAATPGPDEADTSEATPLLLPASHSPSLTASPSPSSTRSPSLSRPPSSLLSPTTLHSRRRTRTLRILSLLAALLSALCAGSVTVFALYGRAFQSRLHYSQYQVNGLASAASVAMYVPVPLLGYACDRAGPAPLALLAGALFGVGYGGAAGAYRRACRLAEEAVLFAGEGVGVGGMGERGLGVQGGGENGGEDARRWCYAMLVLAFVAIGVGTCSMYMSAVATCAKNFGRGKHRGLAVAGPIAAFGLSGMWLSQVGSRLFAARGDGAGEGDGEVDVFRFFIFLAVLLVVVGIMGALGLRIVDEEDLIEEAVEELERSGILDSSVIFTPGRSENGYGAVERRDPFDDIEGETTKDPEEEEEEARLKKQWVLNAETRRFLTDHTMWCFALGFFFMIGPGEAFINNMGTIIRTLYPPALHFTGRPTSAATHVSIVGVTSTIARLLTGTLTDLLAPSPRARHVQITASHNNSFTSRIRHLPAISRVTFLLVSALLLSLGLASLAAGLAQGRGDRFWVVSGLVGAGYGAVFSLTPIIITVIWGVENFATNWGIVAMFPALGSTLWGVVYSAVYQAGAERDGAGGAGAGGEQGSGGGGDDDNLCYGEACYAPAFWAMAASVWIACGLVLWAWKGRNGWSQRGIVV